MSTPVYPKAISSWTDRIDQINTVFAADPNTLAAEIIAVEKTIGTMPQVEPFPPVGNPVAYSNMSARITDTLLARQHPYVSLFNPAFNAGYGTAPDDAIYNVYKKLFDPFGYYNGSDITIKTAGLYLIDVYQAWVPFTSGYMQLSLVINGIWTRGSLWQWNFPSDGPVISPGGTVTFGGPNNPVIPSQVNRYPRRNANTGFTWLGSLGQGDRVRVTSENGTTLNPYPVQNASLKAYYLRDLSDLGLAPGGGKQG